MVQLSEQLMPPKSDRMSIEIGDLREQIENLRSDSLWHELSLAAKFRFLVRLGIKAEQAGLTAQLESGEFNKDRK